MWLRNPAAAARSAVAADHSSRVCNATAILSRAASSLRPQLSSISRAYQPGIAGTGGSKGQLVRFTGMVQDVWDNELYVFRDGNGHSALLSECCVGADDDSSGSTNVDMNTQEQPVLGERLPVYLVAPPGLTQWAMPPHQSSESSPYSSSTCTRPKRQRDQVDENDDITMTDDPPRPMVSATSPETGNKRMTTGSMAGRAPDESDNSRGHSLGLNLPTGFGTGSANGLPAVIAKFYDEQLASEIGVHRIHSLVDIVGVLYPGPTTSTAQPHCASASGDLFSTEAAAKSPGGVATLHVISASPMPGQGVLLNPLLSNMVSLYSVSNESVESKLRTSRHELVRNGLPALRQNLIACLANVLHGDVLAAEYLLLALLGRPVTRSDADGVIGRLTLNLVLPRETATEDANRICTLLESLLPAVSRARVSIPALNSSEWYPVKDYAANRLRAAPLQLPAGCLLVSDETGLDSGRLSEKGAKNIRALTSVMTKATLPVDFQYYESELLFDAGAISLSAGSKSIVPADVLVRVASTENRGTHFVPESQGTFDMESLRLALSLLTEDGEYSIRDEVARSVEDTFVAARKAGTVGNAGQEVLSRWLTVARLVSRSFGESELSNERWQYVLRLEEALKSRNTTQSTERSSESGHGLPTYPIGKSAPAHVAST